MLGYSNFGFLKSKDSAILESILIRLLTYNFISLLWYVTLQKVCIYENKRPVEMCYVES